MALIENLVVALGMRTQNFDKNIDKSKKKLGGFQGATSKLNASLKSFAMRAGAAAVAFLGVRQGVAEIQESMARLDVLGKTADKLGIATEQLQAMRLAAGQMAGVSAGQFDTALQRMVRRLSEAGTGAGEALGAIRELGIDAKRLSQLTPDKQMRVLADALSKVGSQADKVRLAFKFFDSEGVALINMLKDGSGALDEFYKEAERLGILMSRSDIAKVEAANDAFDKMKQVVNAIWDRITIALAPALTVLVNLMTELILKTDIWGKVFANITEGIMWFIGALGDSINALTAIMAHFQLVVEALTTKLADAMMGGIPGTEAILNDINRRMEEAGEKLEEATRGAFREKLMQDFENAKREMEKRLEELDSMFEGMGGGPGKPGAYERGSQAAEAAAARAVGSNMQVEAIDRVAAGVASVYRTLLDMDRRVETIETSFGLEAGIV